MQLGAMITGVFMTALSAIVAGGGFAAAVLLRIRKLSTFGLTRTPWKWILAGCRPAHDVRPDLQHRPVHRHPPLGH